MRWSFHLFFFAGNVLLSAIFLSLATYQSIYPLTLCAPALLYLTQVCSRFSLCLSLTISVYFPGSTPLFDATPCFCFSSPSVSTSRWTSDDSASGGSSRSTPSCTWEACSSWSVSPFSCSARGTTCRLSTASCERGRKSLSRVFLCLLCVDVLYVWGNLENVTLHSLSTREQWRVDLFYFLMPLVTILPW